MPTICEIKMELKELGVKGITGKNKAELMAMLEHAKAPKPKGIPTPRKKKPIIEAEAPAPEPVKPKREIEWSPSQKAFFDFQKQQKEKAEKRESEITEALKELRQVMSEAIEASKEGGLYKKRENWKGKAGFMKKIDKLWEKFPAGIDLFRREIPFNFGWNPKQSDSGESHEHYMYRTTGRNIDWDAFIPARKNVCFR